MVPEDSIPVEIPSEIPETLNATRKVNGVRFVAGKGIKPSRVMFIATSVLEEEERDYQRQSYADPIRVPSEYLKGLTGSILRNTTQSFGVDVDQNYYTAWIKWLAPKTRRLRPTKEMIAAGRALIHKEIQQVDPDIIVCFGKPVFDELSGTKFKLDDIAGAWFDADLEGRKRLLYPVRCITQLSSRPDKLDQFRQEIAEVSRMVSRRKGTYIESYQKDYRVVDTEEKLRALVQELKRDNRTILSVDCEWHGMNYKVGELRSLQICWAPGKAAYIRFRDDKLNYALDISYKKAGEILSEWLDDPRVKYVGHHIPADLPWMAGVLGLQWYQKTLLDTEFAQQCVEEASSLGLESIAMAYTDMGRYDLPLLLWKKKNSKLCQDGYGLIPDDIMIPYGCSDVDVPMRAYPQIIIKLLQDYGNGSSYRYYHNIFNPFVSDVFTSFSYMGLPIDQDRIDLLRDLYQYART